MSKSAHGNSSAPVVSQFGVTAWSAERDAQIAKLRAEVVEPQHSDGVNSPGFTSMRDISRRRCATQAFGVLATARHPAAPPRTDVRSPDNNISGCDVRMSILSKHGGDAFETPCHAHRGLAMASRMAGIASPESVWCIELSTGRFFGPCAPGFCMR
ncbi:hypothetical protein ACQP1G_11725 [Nocardia sp. CA-107356]|uniref:hypothetical protein n=1 Tax=Nocardia sp. CA-107356 TaxID=3239972 RepID=UPI003D8BE4C3